MENENNVIYVGFIGEGCEGTGWVTDCIRGNTEGINKAAGEEYRQYERHMQSAYAFSFCVFLRYPAIWKSQRS